jgi:hypothetical protein
MPGIEQDAHHAPVYAYRRHGVVHQNGRGAPIEGRRIAPEGLGCKIIHLPPVLQVIHSRQ